MGLLYILCEFPEDGTDLPKHVAVMKNHTFINMFVTCIATGYGLEGPGFRNPVVALFSAPVQTGPAPTQSPLRGYPVFPGVKAAGA
jgi:hypothetical protein